MDINIDYNSTVGDSTSELLYETEQEKALHVSKAADQQEPMRPMGGSNEAVKIEESKLDLFYFSFHFYFLFSIFRTTRVRVDRSHCHISHNLMA